MNNGYTQANKKREVAKKMGLTMHGKDSGYGGGIKYEGNGHPSTNGGGMKYDQHGKGAKGGRGQKAPEANVKGNFIGKKFYSQNGKA